MPEYTPQIHRNWGARKNVTGLNTIVFKLVLIEFTSVCFPDALLKIAWSMIDIAGATVNDETTAAITSLDNVFDNCNASSLGLAMMLMTQIMGTFWVLHADQELQG